MASTAPYSRVHGGGSLFANDMGGVDSSGSSMPTAPPNNMSSANNTYGTGSNANNARGGGGGVSHRLVVCLAPETPNLHLSFIDSDVAAIFNLCGPTRQCHTFIHPPRPGGGTAPSLPFAVVDFYSGPPAAEAVTSLNGTVLPNLGTIQIHRLSPEESVEEKVQSVYASYMASIGHSDYFAGSDMPGNNISMQHPPMILNRGVPGPVGVPTGASTSTSSAPMDQTSYRQQQQPVYGQQWSTADEMSTSAPRNDSLNAAEALKQLATLLQQAPGQQANAQPQQQQSMPPQQIGSVPPYGQHNMQQQQQQHGGYGALSNQQHPNRVSTGGASPMYLARMEFVNLFGVEGFDVTSAVLGERDRNIHFILEQAEHKVSISLKGIPANDAPVAERLHMAITSPSKPHFDRAVDMAEDLLLAVCRKVVNACNSRRLKVPPNVGIIKHLYIGDQTPDGSGANFQYQGNVRHLNPPQQGGGSQVANTSKRMRV
eukprot:Blabericola_migrator_1__814@NODE_11_length_24785_cov_110_100736_g8_i0_p7_GENE_NODE_11_length_24785_cov_110_100736_g8_i0NODE_11_length_24785_cov_110_100736_g8_i0_p7_ORF_typecomplete_len485_score62_48RRM_1/PF00076_22/0_024RCR/PF12273_8/1_1e03RCR/PF12273_8/0_36RCR/PF12273_8/1_6e04_NODE_11_length_24785_cov_110_100736_g8_i0894810402